MNPILALLGLEVRRRYVEREANTKENKDVGSESTERRLLAIDADQKALLRKMAQHFVYPATEHPPTAEIVELSDVFSSLLRDVVQRGTILLLCEPTPDLCGLQSLFCTGERFVELPHDCSGFYERNCKGGTACLRSDEGLSQAAFIGVTSPQRLRVSHAEQHLSLDSVPSFEMWDADLLSTLRRTGDVISQAHNEMLALLDALSDGRFPHLLSEERTKCRQSLWTEIVCFFEDAFEVVLRNLVQFILWCIHQHLLGRQGLAVHPLFTVKALWSYSSSGVITSPSPPELHERFMRKVKKELIWILVPEFRLGQMTKRPVSSLGRTSRPALRSTFMDDSSIKRLWEAIHYTAHQRCEEINKAVCGLTETYVFYFSYNEEYYTRLGAQRLREMVVAMRNCRDEVVQSVGAGAFAIQTQTLRQIVLDKLEPLLKAVQAACGKVIGCEEGNIELTRWKELMDVHTNMLSADALAKRLNTFRAGQKISNKYDKGLDPVAHIARFLGAQRMEVARMYQECPIKVKSECGRGKVRQNENNNSCVGTNNVNITEAAKPFNRCARPSSASPASAQSIAQTSAESVVYVKQATGLGPMLSARGIAATRSETSFCAHGDQPLPCTTGYASRSLLQRGEGLEAARSRACDSLQQGVFYDSGSPKLFDKVCVTDKPAVTEHMIPYSHQERLQSLINDVPVANMNSSSQDSALAKPEPVTTIPSSNLTLSHHICNAAAAEIATQRAEALRKLCSFLPDVLCPGVFLEDLNLADSRLEAALNRLRAVRGNASVIRNYRMLAQVEDSVSALLETLAAELSTATLRMQSHYPFLESRVKGVLLGNILELEMDDKFQSLLKLRQQVEKEQKPTKSIDERLLERVCVLANDIPYLVTYERYSAHSPLLPSSIVPSCAFTASLPLCDGDNSCSNKLADKAKCANVFRQSNLESSSREFPMQSEQMQNIATHVKSCSDVAFQRQHKQSDQEAKKVAKSTTVIKALEQTNVCRTAGPHLTSQVVSKENSFLKTRPSVNGVQSPGAILSETKAQTHTHVSKLPASQAASKQRKSFEWVADVVGKPSPAENYSVERHETPGVVHSGCSPASVSNSADAANDFSIDNKGKCSDSLFFSSVRRVLDNEREQLEHLESVLKKVYQNVVAPEEHGVAKGAGNAERATSVDSVNEISKDRVQQTGRLSLQGQHSMASLTSPVAQNTKSEAAVSPNALASSHAVTAGDAAPLGPLFEERHSAQASRGSCADDGGDLLRRLIEERRKMSEAQRVREREQVVQKLRRLKGDVRSGAPTDFGSLADAVVKSSWGTVRNCPLMGQPQLLPSLPRGLSHGGVGRAQQMAHEPLRQESQGNQRQSWGRHTIHQRSLLGVTLQKGPSSAPDMSRCGEDSLDLFPTISSKTSADNLPHTPQAPEWEAISNIAMGMRQQYAALCRQVGIKPNSMLLRALPDTHGVSVSRIDTSINYIGPKGLAPLLQVLRGNIGLEYLNLSHNNLENDEVIDLVNVLMTESGASLRFLDLSNNPVSLAGGAALLRLAQARPSLQSIRLKGTLVPQQLSRSINEVCSSRHGDPH